MLEATSLTYRHESRNLIENISLKFSKGLLFGVLGPNGSGKSTLLKTLAGIWTPAEGEVLWNEENLLHKSRQEISRIVTLVPQNPQVHFDFSVTEMVEMGRYPLGCTSHKNRGLLDWALATVDAWHLRNRSILRLSHGERKRIYIARALITESPVLLLDEPTASLDIRHQLEIWQLLRKLIDQGKIVIVTNHDLYATERFCDTIAVLKDGRCISQGPYQEVLTDDLLHDVFGVQESTTPSMKQYDVI